MTFFSLHGFAIDVANGSWDFTPEMVGEVKRRGATGNLRSTRRALKGTWTGTTTILDPSDAEAIYAFFTSQHDVWSFDQDIYSSKGYSWSTNTPTLDATNKKFGASSMSAASSKTYKSGWAESTTRVISLWRRPGSGSFDHYLLVCSGSSVTSAYKNGVVGASVSNWFSANSDGSFNLVGKNDAGTNTTVQYDDIMVVPLSTATQAMATAWSAATTAWPDSPNIECSGTGFAPQAGTGSPTVTVDPSVSKSKAVMGVSPLDGSYKDDLAVMSFAIALV